MLTGEQPFWAFDFPVCDTRDIAAVQIRAAETPHARGRYIISSKATVTPAWIAGVIQARFPQFPIKQVRRTHTEATNPPPATHRPSLTVAAYASPYASSGACAAVGGRVDRVEGAVRQLEGDQGPGRDPAHPRADPHRHPAGRSEPHVRRTSTVVVEGGDHKRDRSWSAFKYS